MTIHSSESQDDGTIYLMMAQDVTRVEPDIIQTKTYNHILQLHGIKQKNLLDHDKGDDATNKINIGLTQPPESLMVYPG